jgi:beta-1,4-N-acetylglucosaminyltransferase
MGEVLKRRGSTGGQQRRVLLLFESDALASPLGRSVHTHTVDSISDEEVIVRHAALIDGVAKKVVASGEREREKIREWEKNTKPKPKNESVHTNRPCQVPFMSSVLVTVGSTRFDKLVGAFSSPSLLGVLTLLGYSQLTIQYGKSLITDLSVHSGIQIETFAYKPSLREDMERASLIISHAGELLTFGCLCFSAFSWSSSPKFIRPISQSTERALPGSGSILEALRLNKKLIVVVNEDLMDNHQLELGSALHQQGYLVCCNVP